MELQHKRCIPCEGKISPLSHDEIKKYLAEVTTWRVIQDQKISKEFLYKDFAEAMKFVEKVAAIAEEEGHHPDIHIFYNKVSLELFTHAAGGLTENDFILAAKIDTLTS